MEKYRIGLAMNEKNLILAVVAREKSAWRLLETMTSPVTAESRQQALREARRNIPRKARHVILGLPHHQTLMKEIDVDSTLTDGEIHQYLRQQALTLFGKPADHWFFDFTPCRFAAKIPAQTSYRVVAAPREHLAAELHSCRDSGFLVRAVDVDILALVRLAHTFADYSMDQPQALLWVKATELVLIVTQAGELIYAKRAPYSCAQPLIAVFTPLLQFFSGLYPQHVLEKILLLNESSPSLTIPSHIQTAALDPGVWKISADVQADTFCSLGLAIYGD